MLYYLTIGPAVVLSDMIHTQATDGDDLDLSAAAFQISIVTYFSESNVHLHILGNLLSHMVIIYKSRYKLLKNV